MPNLPSTRQNRDTRSEPSPRLSDPLVLARAFATFTEAAGSLEKSYLQLQGEVSKLRADLEQANAKLSRSLEENTRARAFLTQVLDRLPCGVLVSYSNGRIRLLNPEARRLLDLDSQSSSELTIPGEWLSKANSNDPYFECDWPSPASPESRALAVSVAFSEAAPHAPHETIWIVRDISEQKRAAAEREEIRRAQALADIAKVLAHEIRNPLGSMELFTSLLGEATKEAPEAREWVMHLQSGLRSLSATVNNVLQFHGKPCGEFLPVRIDRVLEHTVQFLTPLAAAQGHNIHLENSVGPVTVAADSHRLQQAFLNFALNGFRAMQPGGNLAVRLQRAAHSKPEILRIDFEDEGCGIAPCFLEEIFEPGFTTKAGSPGLGLTVCKKVIEEHGGTVSVESSLKCGSTFNIYLAATEEVCD
jgi:signal transduction histidine kinase